MESSTIANMSDAQLRDELITCDYHGKDVKSMVLDELLRRAKGPPMSGSMLKTPEDRAAFRAEFEKRHG